MKWFVLQVMTGAERAVALALANKGFTARTPSEIVPIRRGGSIKEEEKLLFPSYVFVELDYTADIFHCINRIPNVIRFLGMEFGAPSFLSQEDNEWITLLSGNDAPIGISEVEFDSYGKPRIVSGILLEIENHIMKIDRRQRRATIEIDLLGEKKRITLGIKAVQHESVE